jgi:hypothetical protein
MYYGLSSRINPLNSYILQQLKTMKIYELFENVVAYDIIVAIKKLLLTQIKNPQQKVSGAVNLVNQCYQASGAQVPKDFKDPSYKQYNDIVIYAVKQPQKATDAGIRDGSWKLNSDDSPYV